MKFKLENIFMNILNLFICFIPISAINRIPSIKFDFFYQRILCYFTSIRTNGNLFKYFYYRFYVFPSITFMAWLLRLQVITLERWTNTAVVL